MKFADFSDFKDDFNNYLNIAEQGEDVIITKKGKPILSLAGIKREDLEDFILAKHYKLEKKAKSIEARTSKIYSHKEVKKHLGF